MWNNATNKHCHKGQSLQNSMHHKKVKKEFKICVIYDEKDKCSLKNQNQNKKSQFVIIRKIYILPGKERT